MRIETLEITAFGPFRGTQSVDIGALAADGIFLITGRTGAGKSSILDAVCFALYGGVPRYDGDPSRLRSDHADPAVATRVELVFSVGAERYRVVREPEQDRAKTRGGGMTRAAQKASLERWDGGRWEGLAARPSDVATLLGPVLNLSRAQFQQVILLAQGRFSEFLRATSDARVGLLRALFGTARFEAVEKAVQERARAARDTVGAATERHAERASRLAVLASAEEPSEPDAGWARTTAAGLQARADAARVEAERAAALLAEADALAAATAATADLQRRRDDARTAETALLADGAVVAALRRENADAERAAAVADVLGAADRARAAAESARAVLEQREVAAGDLPADLAAAIDAAAKQAGALEAALAAERSLPALRARLEAAIAGSRDRGRAVADLEARLTDVPALRAALSQRVRAAADALAAEPAATQSVEAASRVLEAATAVVALNAEQRRALTDELEARTAAAAAVEAARVLAAARLAASAGVLAAGLEPGAPCPVCGSLEHPAPASNADVVADADVDAADAAAERARAAFETARDRLTDVSHRRATAETAAHGADAESATAALAAARAEHDRLRAAASDLSAAEAALAALEAREGELTRDVAAARAATEEAGTAEQRGRADLEAAEQQVAAARGSHPSVAEHATAVDDRLGTLRGLERARQDAAAASVAAEEAQELLSARLADERFDDEAAARAALRPSARREQLAARIRDHEEGLQKVRAVLDDPAVAAAPVEPVDTAETEEAKARALAARVAAAEAQTSSSRDAAEAALVAGEIEAGEARIGDARRELAVVGPLAATLRGEDPNTHRMRLETYVLAARLEQIVAAANGRLSAMTGGRFTLRHSDAQAAHGARSGLGIEVLDEHTGRPRSPESLSGGETFLASLALALGLAEVVGEEAGGVRLDTLFVDEGFGSLDRETLDTAMATLDTLRAGGRVVGLISHVEAMQEDIPAGLHVERLPDGSSAVRVRDASMAP